MFVFWCLMYFNRLFHILYIYSEDELFLSYNAGTPSANQVNKQLTRQLEKDGYRLDEMPDDEELDLIPPREFREAKFCSCCNAFKISCAIM